MKMRASDRLPSPTAPLDVRLMRATANVLVALCVVAAAAAGIVAWTRQPQFAVKAIRVEGDVARLNIADVRANALPHLSGNFFSVDLAAARHAFEAVPWVRRAEVRRVWPNQLVVRIEAHRAAALWSGDEAVAEAHPEDKLVDVQGDVFEANVGDVEDDNLLTLSGPDGSAPQVLLLAGRLRPVLEKALATRLESLTLSRRGSWRAVLESGAEIELGRGTDDEVVARADRFVATLPQVAERYQRPLEYADLRHVDGYAVRLAGITTGDAPTAPAPVKPKVNRERPHG